MDGTKGYDGIVCAGCGTQLTDYRKAVRDPLNGITLHGKVRTKDNVDTATVNDKCRDGYVLRQNIPRTLLVAIAGVEPIEELKKDNIPKRV